MTLQKILLSLFGCIALVAINGCVVHEHSDHWGHHHDHTVVIEHR